jgi:hypothetical protein
MMHHDALGDLDRSLPRLYVGASRLQEEERFYTLLAMRWTGKVDTYPWEQHFRAL